MGMAEAYTGKACVVSNVADRLCVWLSISAVVNISFLDLCCNVGIIDLLAVMSMAVNL
jgi:hypothetical protein